MTIAIPPAQFAAPRAAAWQRHLVALALVCFTLLVAFRGDVRDLVHIWWTSTTFGHCLFILPVVAWLIWGWRRELARLTPVAWWPGLLVVAAGGAGWLLGEAASVALARQLGLVMMLQGAAIALLGPNVARGLAFALAYLFFAVPFGEELEPPLQQVTVAMVMPMLHLVGIPASVDGVMIHAGRYWFEVAEACSGAKFVIAMLAYGALVANVCFRSWRRRAIFMGIALVVPVLANAVRAFGTIWAADLTSVERATGFDHIVYGWIFFGIVMLLVMAIGWRWFDRAPDDAVFDPAALSGTPARRLALVPAAALVLAVALLFPAWNAATAGRGAALPARITLPDVPGWTRAPMSTRAEWSPYYPAADHFLLGRYVDASGDAVDVSIAVFARQREGAELIAFGTGVLREGDRWIRVADTAPIDGGSTMRIVASGRDAAPVERTVATWYRLAGITTADETRVKLATMTSHLTGGDQRAIAIHVSAEERRGSGGRLRGTVPKGTVPKGTVPKGTAPGIAKGTVPTGTVPGEGARAAIARFVAALGPIGPAADRIVGGGARVGRSLGSLVDGASVPERGQSPRGQSRSVDEGLSPWGLSPKEPF